MAEEKKLKELTEDELKNATGGGNGVKACLHIECDSGKHWDPIECRCVSNVITSVR